MLLLEVVEPVAFDAQIPLFLRFVCFVLVFAGSVHGHLPLSQAGMSLGRC